MFKILVINPGSTSTKVGVFEDETMIKEYKIKHTAEELKTYPTMAQEAEYRKNLIISALKKDGIDPSVFSAFSCRGGILKPIPSGTYLVDDNILYDSLHSPIDQPSNPGPLIGDALRQEYGKKAYITDPPSTFEAPAIATLSGLPEIERKLRCHALNHKAIAKKHCHEQKIDYKKVNLIVCHLGGGISIAMHDHGVIVDTNDATGEGPFGPERTGSLPVMQLTDLCFSGKYTREQVRRMLRGEGGFFAYLGTTDMQEIMKRVNDGEAKAKLCYDAFVYQVAKEIGSLTPVTKGTVDAILMTGGICHNKQFTDDVVDRVGWIAPVFIYPGEEELPALNWGVLNVLRGKEKAKIY